MENTQLSKLLMLYKAAIEQNLSPGEFAKEVLDAKIQLDKVFTLTGSEDENLKDYLTELEHLNKYTNE